jgi:ATP-binding cassette subfamily F protein 3
MVVDAARQYLARFRFYGDDPFRAVGSLSGGERTRLALAQAAARAAQFPPARRAHQPPRHPRVRDPGGGPAHFEGTVVLVSHDRYFLDRVSTRVLHLEGGKATFYPGGYADYHARRALHDGAGVTVDKREVGPPKAGGEARAAAKPAPAPVSRESHEERKRKARDLEKRQRRVGELEKLIAEGEAKLKGLRAELAEDPGGDWQRVATPGRRGAEARGEGRRVDRGMDAALGGGGCVDCSWCSRCWRPARGARPRGATAGRPR